MAKSKKVETKKTTNATNKQSTKKQVKEEKKVTKVEVEEVEVETEEMADIMDEKEKKTLDTSVVKIVWNIVFWTVFVILAFVWIFDFINVVKEQDPKFCVSKKLHKYEDGEVSECVGLGYKVYNYNRTSIGTGYEFGPFFIKIKENKINN